MTRTAKQLLALQEPFSVGMEPILSILQFPLIRSWIMGNSLLHPDDQLNFKDRLNFTLASSSVFYCTVDMLFEWQQEGMYHRREEYPLVLGSRAAHIFAAYRNAAEKLILRNEYYPVRLDTSRLMNTYPHLKTVQFESAERVGTRFVVTVRPGDDGLQFLEVQYWSLVDPRWLEKIGDWTLGVLNNPKYRLQKITAPRGLEWRSIESAFQIEGTQRALEHVEVFEGDIPAVALLHLLPMPSLRDLRFRVQDHQIDPQALFIQLAGHPKLQNLGTNFKFGLAVAALETSELRVEQFTCNADPKWCRKENQSGIEPGIQTQWKYSALLGETIDAAWQHDSPVKEFEVFFDTPPTLDTHHVALLIRSRAPWCKIKIEALKDGRDETALDVIEHLVKQEHYETKATLIAAGFGPWLEEEP